MRHDITRRRMLAALPAFGTFGAFAQGASWPTKPIRWVVPYAAGGTADVLAREVGARMGERLGQPIVIENRPGAGGNTGTDFVAKSPPDGYTWVMGNIGPMAVNISLYKNLPFDPVKDLQPISLLLAYPNMIVANPVSGPKSMKELLDRARVEAVPFAGNGVGTSLHLTGELLARSANIKLSHVPYRGEPPGLTDTMSGVVPIAITPIASGLPLVKAGKLRALAVTSTERSQLAPDVPTVAESGVPGFEVTGWVGILVPRATPAPIVTRLVSEFNTVMQMPEIKRAVAIDMASFVPPLGPEYFAKFIGTETEKWRDVVVAANLKVE